jgi:hypothetical protein
MLKKKKKKVEKLLFDTEINRLKLATSLIPKIQENLEQEGFFELIKISSIEPGQILSKYKITDEVAVAIDESGENVEIIRLGDRIFPPEFIISSIPTISIDAIMKKQYDVLDKMVKEVSGDILYKITSLWYKLIQTSAQVSNQYFKYTCADLINDTSSVEYFINFIKKGTTPIIEKGDKPYLVVRREMLGPFKKLSNMFDKPIQEILEAEIIVMLDVDNGFVTKPPVMSENQILCIPNTPIVEMDTRVDLCAITADKLKDKKPAFGFLYVQMHSLCVPDCSKISIIELPK